MEPDKHAVLSPPILNSLSNLIADKSQLTSLLIPSTNLSPSNSLYSAHYSTSLSSADVCKHFCTSPTTTPSSPPGSSIFSLSPPCSSLSTSSPQTTPFLPSPETLFTDIIPSSPSSVSFPSSPLQSTATSPLPLQLPVLTLPLPPRGSYLDFRMFGYKHVRPLSHGSHTSTHLVQSCHGQAGEMLVAKVLDLCGRGQLEVERALAEAKHLRELQHPCIVEYRESFLAEDGCSLVIVMEYCEGGDLFAYIASKQEQGHLIEEARIWAWFGNVVSGLVHMHNTGVLHCDLKTTNIFLTSEGKAKIGDFGISKVLKQDYLGSTPLGSFPRGTPIYMSPEMCSGCLPLTVESDLWSLGCVLYEMCCLLHAFRGNTPEELLLSIDRDLEGIRDRIPASYSQLVGDIVVGLLKKWPQERLSLDQIMQYLSNIHTDGSTEISLFPPMPTVTPPATKSTPLPCSSPIIPFCLNVQSPAISAVLCESPLSARTTTVSPLLFARTTESCISRSSSRRRLAYAIPSTSAKHNLFSHLSSARHPWCSVPLSEPASPSHLSSPSMSRGSSPSSPLPEDCQDTSLPTTPRLPSSCSVFYRKWSYSSIQSASTPNLDLPICSATLPPSPCLSPPFTPQNRTLCRSGALTRENARELSHQNLCMLLPPDSAHQRVARGMPESLLSQHGTAMPRNRTNASYSFSPCTSPSSLPTHGVYPSTITQGLCYDCCFDDEHITFSKTSYCSTCSTPLHTASSSLPCLNSFLISRLLQLPPTTTPPSSPKAALKQPLRFSDTMTTWSNTDTTESKRPPLHHSLSSPPFHPIGNDYPLSALQLQDGSVWLTRLSRIGRGIRLDQAVPKITAKSLRWGKTASEATRRGLTRLRGKGVSGNAV